MLKSIQAHWKRAVSGLLAVVMASSMFSTAALGADALAVSPATDTANVYAPTGDFELNVAGATAWNGGGQALIVYKAESGSAKNTTIPDAVPFALLEDNGGDRIKIGYVADGPWTGSTLDATGWADKDDILVNLPDVIPSIAYDRDVAKQFNSRLTRHEYVIPGTYALAEQLAQLQKSAMNAGDTLVVRQSSQTVSVSHAKGDPAQLHSYSLDGAAYQKYDAWTEYEDQDDSLIDLSYELPYSVNRAFSADPSITLTMFCPQAVSDIPAMISADDPTGGVGAYNPGSPGGKKPGTSNVAWSTDPERTFLRFTLLEFPQGVVTDLNTTDYGTWHVVGTPLNVVWSKGSDGDTWSVDKCRSDITWYNSNAMQYNGQGDNAPQLMEGTVYSYDATANPQWVTTADAFQAATGISDAEKEQMFHCNSSSWSTGWRDGDYTSMWGTDAESITPGNPYKVYEANDAFIYLLGQLSAPDKSTGWSADEAMEKWSEYVHDADGNLRTKYRIIVETGCIFKDPDGYRRAMTLREMMAYSLYNSEGSGQYTLIYDQSSTSVNMARWMYQGKDNQFLEYPLDESGAPTGEELHSTNGFKECESFIGSITYGRAIRDSIFSDRVSFGLHIFSPFNFETLVDKPNLEVTKKVTSGISADEEFGFTVKYTAGSPAGFTAMKNGVDCTSQVTSTGDGLKFKLKADETIHIDFDADASFRCEVTEDDSSNLTGITGTGGTADMTAKKFTTTSGTAKATFTNGTTPPPPDIPDDPDDPPPGTSILYKRDANTNAGVGPATFKFSSIVNGVYEFDTDRTGTLETIQWWDPTGAAGKYIKPGEYAVTEIIPPPNYMPTTEVQQIKLELDADGNPIPAGPLVFKNLPKVGLRILKYDRLTHRPMNGVTFEIFRDGVSIGRYETNGNGEILLTDIEPGTYRAVEVDTGDESHIMNGSYQEIELIAGEGIKDLVFFNDVKPGMKLIKVDSANPAKTISGAKFRIRAVAGDYGPQEFITDGKGEIDLSMLPEGAYEITEIECAGYIIDDAQRIIHLKANDTVEFVFTNTKEPELTISKIDADTNEPVPGTVFTVKAIDGDYQDDWTTGADGKVTKSVAPGTYQITEKSVPAPYYLPDKDADRVQTISLNPGDEKTLLFRNYKAPELTIYKEDSLSGEPLAGAKFHVTYTSNGESAEAPASADYGYLLTDENGEIRLHEEGKRLYPGEFTVTEITPPPGYQMKEPSTQRVIIHGGESKRLVFQNEPLNEIIVEKYDSVTGEVVPGCTFQLRYLGGNASGTGGTVVSQKVTDETGTAMWTGLTAGTYVLDEVDAADGYNIIQSSETIYLADDGEKKVITLRMENAPDGSLLIRKVCAVNPSVTLQDAEFKVTYSDGTLIGNSNGIYRTDVNGEILITGLTPGKTVVVTETRAPDGFIIDTQSQTIKIKAGTAVTLTFKNQPKGQLIVQKRDSVTGQPLPGAEFRVTTAAGCEVGLDGVIGTSTLTQNGIFTTDGNGEIRISNLAPGAYVLTEIKAPDGYVMDSPSTNVVIGANGDTQTVVIKNTPKGGLLIRKIDSVTGKVLPGVKFKVVAANGELVPDNEGLTSSNGIYTTDENGQIYLQKLNPNTYVVTEIETLDGYLLDAMPQTVVVDGADTQVLTFTNMPLGGLLVKKMDSATKEPLADVIFKITRTDGTVVGTSNGEYRTDERGFISIPNLEPGSYIVQEVQTKAGYLLDDTPHVVEIKDHQTYTLEVFNQPLGNLIINKRSTTDNTPLEGVKFEIKYADGRVVDNLNGQMSSNGLYTTDSNGQIIISGIIGTVVVTELETIPGYVIDQNTRTQTVTINPADTQTLTFYNEPLCNLTLIKLDSVTRKPLADTEFTVREGNGGLIGRYVTGENGTATVTGLIPGSTVVVYESRVPDGYVLNAMPQTITVYNDRISSNGGSIVSSSGNSLTFTDDPKMTLTIHKYIEGTANKPLAGVAFKVVDDTGKPLNPDAGIFYTNNAGEIILGGLEPGMTITAQEVKTVDGYVLDGRPQSIKIEAGAAQNLTFWNSPAGTLVIQKKDKITGAAIAGAEFQLTYANGGYVDNDNGHLSSNGIYTTDNKGEIRITGVVGTIVAKETKAAPGYVIDQSTQTQTVTVNPQETQTLTFFNVPMNTLTIQKYIDGSNNTPLAGVEFLVTDSSGAVVGPNNGYYTTDRNGLISISGLTPGTTITVRETKTVDGYILDGTPQSILIKEGEPLALTFWNKKAGGLVVNKIDAVTKKPLTGVKFKITYADGSNVDLDGGKTSSNGIYTTDSMGQIKITGIVGTVIVEEIETVSGYYIDPNTKSQTVQISANDTQTLTFTNTPTQSLVIQKLVAGTKDQPLAGVEFLVTDSSGAAIGPNDGVYRTDAQGRITITDLIPGTVITAREVKTLEGYVLDSTPQSREIKSGEVQTMTFYNEKAGTLVVQKKDKISGALISGAQFQISYLTGEFVTAGDSPLSSKGLYTTDNTGEIRISGITGTVVVKEIQAASGYVIDQATQTQTAKVDPMDTKTLVFLNEPLCSLTLCKLDSVTGKPIPGTEFTVKDTNGTIIGRYVTGEDGTVVVTGLIPGNTYVVNESRVPDGYVLNPTPQTITVTNGTGNGVTSGGTSSGASGGTVTGTGNSLTFTDDPKTTLTIHKYIEGTANEPLAGVAFKVVDGSGAPLNPDGGIYYTNNAGEIILEGLEPGMTITAHEIKTVDGYVLDGNPQSIKIEAGKAQNLTFWNKPAGSLVIRKLDKQTGEPLAGVEFELMYAEGGYVDNANGHLSSNGLYTTDDHGEIHISGVTGTIVVKETRPLSGYTIEPGREQQTVTVKPQETQTLTFFNIPANTLTIQKYIDGTNNEPLAGVEFLVTDSSGSVVGPNNGYYTTDKDGRISISGLTPGITVTVKETKTVDGYVLDGNPKSILIKEGEAQSLTFWNKKAGGLIVNKIDAVSREPLVGVKFKITYADGSNVDMDGGKISSNGIYTTDAMGQIKITGIVGTIIVEEIETVSGYYIDPSAKSQTVQVNADDTQTLTFTNTPTQSLVIQKLEAGTKDQPLAGVEFLITDSNGAFVGPNDGIYRTDAQGRITITDLIPGAVITAKEVKTLDGYVLDGTPQSREIKSGEVQTMTFYNEKAGTLVVQKKDKFSDALIAGAQFQISYLTGEFVTSGDSSQSNKGIYTTDNTGEIRISGITGTVVVKEIQAASGYVIDPATQTQTVTVNPMDTQTLVFLNEPLCSLTLSKIDSVTGKPVPGTEFTVKDTNGTIIGRYVTGEDGTVVVTGLIPGNTYVVNESRVPAGYVLNPTPKTITVTNGTGNGVTSSGTTSGGTVSGTVTGTGNSLTFADDPKMTLTIHKYIEGTANEPLAGVAFKVTEGNGTPVGPGDGVFYTNNAGEIVVEGLEPGITVTAQEIKTVDGFVLDGTPKSVKITADSQAPELVFWNKPAGSLVIRKLDKQTNKPLAGVEFELMYAEGGYVDNANGHLSSNGLYTTDDHGEIHISGVTGTIVVKETRPLSGYTIEPGREQQIVTVKPQETQTLTFFNIPANILTIQKYIDGTANEPLAGVEFLVTDSTGAVVGSNNGYYTTDKDGRISIPGLVPGTTITVKETKTVDGYVLDGNPQSILIKEGEAQTVTFWNKRAGGLIVNKIDAVTKEPLAGVKFRITYADGSNVDMDGGRISSNGLYTTDTTGQIKILGIVGTVIVEEIETIPGYIIDPNAKSQTVQINPNDTQTITFTNAPKQTLVIQKLVTGTKDQPLAGVEFLVTDSSGATLGPNNGIYRTDAQGRITLTDLTPGTVITAKETKTLDGYVLDGTPQSMEIKSGEVQTLTFYNSPIGGLELIKVSESDKTRRIPNTTFEIRKMDGALVETVTTDSAGRVHVDLDAGDYYAVEIEAAQGFKLDNTPHYFTIQNNKTTTLTVTNKAFSGILIHKTDSVTGKGIYGVTFLLYDVNNTPIGQYTSDNSGYVYIENLTTSGRYYLRELENEGYVPDTQMKTVYVTAGQTTLIEWKNIPITAQIQITKKSADYNSTNGLPAGTLLEGAVFEIYDKANNLVDTIRSDSRGLAVSRPLPLGRYTIREVKAPDNYGVSDTDLTAYLEHEGQIVRFEVTNKSLSTGVSITKTGPKEAMSGQPVNYVFTSIANNSNVRLDNFYWRDTLPAQVRLDTVITGTYNFPGVYKITYRVNGGEYRTLADNLSTSKNYTLAASPAALGLAANERVTEIMFVFGQAPAGFAQVEKPQIKGTTIAGLTAGSSFANIADVGGTYNGVWVQAISRWVTTVYGKPTPLPKTGY